jgi:hypothetical protein
MIACFGRARSLWSLASWLMYLTFRGSMLNQLGICTTLCNYLYFIFAKYMNLVNYVGYKEF